MEQMAPLGRGEKMVFHQMAPHYRDIKGLLGGSYYRDILVTHVLSGGDNYPTILPLVDFRR